MGTESFPGVKYGRGVPLTTHLLLVLQSWKSRAIPLPILWATTEPVARRLYLFLPLVYMNIKIYETIILVVIFYGCETWSLTWREERRLRVFENRVLRRIFGPKRDEVTREWRKLHNEELNDLYSSPNMLRVMKSRRMRWAGHVSRMGKGRGVYRVLVGETWGKETTGETHA